LRPLSKTLAKPSINSGRAAAIRTTIENCSRLERKENNRRGDIMAENHL
jgi:hypothetical protein